MNKGVSSTATITQSHKPVVHGVKANIQTSVNVKLVNAAAAAAPKAAAIRAAKAAPDQVRVVQPSEYKEAAAALAEAFKDDATSAYFIDVPDRRHWTDEQKWDLHVDIMEYITYAHCLKGLVTTVGDDYGCVALWMPPGNSMDDLLTIFRSGMWRLNYKLSAEGKKRFFNEFLPLLHDTKVAVLGARDTDAWYLVYIGTREAARGKGHARRLITHVTDMADAAGQACYLESSNDVNTVIYGKMGFQVRKQIWLQRAEEQIRLDIMVREPASGSKK